MSDAAAQSTHAPHGTELLPRDLTDEELAAASVLASLDDLKIADLTDDECRRFLDALS